MNKPIGVRFITPYILAAQARKPNIEILGKARHGGNKFKCSNARRVDLKVQPAKKGSLVVRGITAYMADEGDHPQAP